MVNGNFWRGESWSSNEFELRISDKLPCEPKEGLFEVVVGLGRDIVVLQVLLSVEGDGLCLYLSLLDIDFVSAKDDWNVLTHTNNITWNLLVGWVSLIRPVVLTMPIGNVLVCDSGCNIEHDDSALTIDVVAIS